MTPETPRTLEAAKRLITPWGTEEHWVPASICEQIERELAQSRKETYDAKTAFTILGDKYDKLTSVLKESVWDKVWNRVDQVIDKSRSKQ